MGVVADAVRTAPVLPSVNHAAPVGNATGCWPARIASLWALVALSGVNTPPF